MLELRAEEVLFCVGCSTSAAELEGSAVEFVRDAIAKADGGPIGSVGDVPTELQDFAVIPDVDAEVEDERAFGDRVSEKLLVTVGTW